MELPESIARYRNKLFNNDQRHIVVEGGDNQGMVSITAKHFGDYLIARKQLQTESVAMHIGRNLFSEWPSNGFHDAKWPNPKLSDPAHGMGGLQTLTLCRVSVDHVVIISLLLCCCSPAPRR